MSWLVMFALATLLALATVGMGYGVAMLIICI
jgi:hypothetical protein